MHSLCRSQPCNVWLQRRGGALRDSNGQHMMTRSGSMVWSWRCERASNGCSVSWRRSLWRGTRIVASPFNSDVCRLHVTMTRCTSWVLKLQVMRPHPKAVQTRPCEVWRFTVPKNLTKQNAKHLANSTMLLLEIHGTFEHASNSETASAIDNVCFCAHGEDLNQFAEFVITLVKHSQFKEGNSKTFSL